MLREYQDKSGVTWRVWDVYPTARGSAASTQTLTTNQSDSLAAYPTRSFKKGWLCFECATEKRRLAPIPVDWEICDCARLEELCRKAGHIKRTGSQDALD